MIAKNKENDIKIHIDDIIDELKEPKNNGSQNLEDSFLKLEKHISKDRIETFKSILNLQKEDIKSMNENQIISLKEKLGTYISKHSSYNESKTYSPDPTPHIVKNNRSKGSGHRR